MPPKGAEKTPHTRHANYKYNKKSYRSNTFSPCGPFSCRR